MANIVPQTPFANRYKFIALEKHEREMAVKYGRLENVTIAFWNNRPKKIGKSQLQVQVHLLNFILMVKGIKNVSLFGTMMFMISLMVKTQTNTNKIVM